jgi:hypothetical protein
VDAASEQMLPPGDAREVEMASEEAAPVAGAVSSQE